MSARATAVACAFVLTGCSAPVVSSSPQAPSSPTSFPPVPSGKNVVLLDFDRPDPLEARSPGGDVTVQAEGGAPVRTAASGDGTRGLVFPAYAAQDEGRLVLLLEPGVTRSTTVGGGGLSYGADVELEPGTASGPTDNGDNVVQRGLYSDQDQFKLQVDKRVPSCTLRTPSMRLVAALDHALGDGWYRLGCHYDGASLTLTASSMIRGAAAPVVVRTDGHAGDLTFPASTMISVGGKITGTGALVRTQPDQFNGALDNVFVSPGP